MVALMLLVWVSAPMALGLLGLRLKRKYSGKVYGIYWAGIAFASAISLGFSSAPEVGAVVCIFFLPALTIATLLLDKDSSYPKAGLVFFVVTVVTWVVVAFVIASGSLGST